MSKISVIHYLNKKLKSKILDGIEYYPVYIRVNYKSKNFRFRSVILPNCKDDNDLNRYKNLTDLESEIINYYINLEIKNDIKSTDLSFSLYLLAYRFSVSFIEENIQILDRLYKEVNNYLEENTIFNFSQIFILRGGRQPSDISNSLFLMELDTSFIKDEELKETIELFKILKKLDSLKDFYFCPFNYKMNENYQKVVKNKFNDKKLLEYLNTYTDTMFRHLQEV
ncbi:hypothetical protein ACTS9E_14495 [Empedobacter brevis]